MIQNHEANDAKRMEQPAKISALLSKLDNFMPKLKEANRELEEQIAMNGDEQYKIDLKESEDSSADEDSSAKADNPVIEMQFALSMMPDEAERSKEVLESDHMNASLDLRLPSSNNDGAPKKIPFGKESRPLITEIN